MVAEAGKGENELRFRPSVAEVSIIDTPYAPSLFSSTPLG